MKVTSALLAVSAMTVLSACSSTEPYVFNWNSDTYYRLDSDDFDEKYDLNENKIQVRICFDQSENSKEAVYELARQTCAERITLKNQILLAKRNQSMAQNSQISTTNLEGPVVRQQRLDQMIASIKLKYMENDKWECSLMHPNRITLECSYNDKFTPTRAVKPAPQIDMELPPELPADLKPE